jgi:hypothetical protein
MSRKKYTVSFNIETQDSSGTSYGSYRTKAPLATTYSKRFVIKKRKNVDAIKELLDGVEKAICILECL